MNYVSSKEAREFLHCTPATLKMYKDKGLIQSMKVSSKKFLYDLDSISPQYSTNRLNVIYARVSCSNQKKDLDHQIEIIKSYMLAKGIKCDKVYKDIASGMNENRVDLQCLISDACANKIDTIYISYKDRLTRFGFGYLEHMFANFNVKIEILDKLEETNATFQDELTNDLISIIHHYSMKLYSNRRKKLKEIENIIKTED